jgi:prolipoprotein diacylglyceryltransferase
MAIGDCFSKDDLIPGHPTQLYEDFSAYFLIFIILQFYINPTLQRGDGLL